VMHGHVTMRYLRAIFVISHGRPPTRSSFDNDECHMTTKKLIVGHTTIKHDEPEVENVARGRSPRATFSTSGSSYLMLTYRVLHGNAPRYLAPLTSTVDVPGQ